MKPVRFNPRSQRLIELSSCSGQVKTRRGRIVMILVLALLAFHLTSPTRLLGPTRGLAQTKVAECIVVGSTGAVDESDLSEYEVRNQFATIKDALTGTVTYRYNLPATAGFQDSTAPKTVRIRYRDSGPNQNVVVRLMAVRLGADGLTTIYSFNSDAGSSTPVAAGANVNANQTFDECSVTLPTDHVVHGRYGYYLEVVVTKTAIDSTSSPGFIGFVISQDGISDVTCP